ncbi:hypothetical protein K469DRAFT_213507 [Zopfia rhizophila CBS 207.26]|uniref:Uncharacterized protein n=1 Tax=Zopfia rhizophila CBS 207.26 TaxID=1314779 RepID=A0A6A6DTX1_9PEZI|nr:hypothetical protein K469DRAFT_213507 [Zopfia rhizophila CBS 207.26]
MQTWHIQHQNRGLAAAKDMKAESRKRQAPSLEEMDKKHLQISARHSLQAPSTSDTFVLMGNLELPELDSSGLHPTFVQHIKKNLPAIQKLDDRDFSTLPHGIVDMEYEFSDFKRREVQAWAQSGREPEPGSSLLLPSGSLEATLAHRLNRPSFTTTLRTGTETADRSNGCIAMVMGNAYRENETLIYDHLHRRSRKSDGLESFPENHGVITCEGRGDLWKAHTSSCPTIRAATHGNSSLG